jgi:hypothetical protein
MDTYRVDRAHIVAAVMRIRKRVAIVATGGGNATVTHRTSTIGAAVHLIFNAEATMSISASAGAIQAASHTGFRRRGTESVRTNGAVGTVRSVFTA